MKKGNYLSTRDAFGEILLAVGDKYPNLIVLDVDTSSSTRSVWFAEKFPDRFFNFGIAEQNVIGVAAGLSTCGKLPIVSSFSAFIPGKCVNQIRNVIAYTRLNVKIVSTHCGVSASYDGATHQSFEDLAIMRTMPNFTVVVPADSVETKKAFNSILKYDGPVYVRLSRNPSCSIFDNDYKFELGKGVILCEGSDATIIACGIMVQECITAAANLKKKNISVTVINLHTLKPLDKDLIERVARDTGVILTAENHNIINGLGGAVSEIVSETYPVPIKRIGVQDHFGESGSQLDLMNKFKLTSTFIEEGIKEAIMHLR